MVSCAIEKRLSAKFLVQSSTNWRTLIIDLLYHSELRSLGNLIIFLLFVICSQSKLIKRSAFEKIIGI